MHIMFKELSLREKELASLIGPISLKFCSQIWALFRNERQHSADIAPLFIGVVLKLYFWCFRPL